MIIYKYPIQVCGTFTIALPRGAKVLCVQMQNNLSQMWVLQGDEELVNRTFLVVGTGWPFEGNLEYIGTYQVPPYVWHLFEEI